MQTFLVDSAQNTSLITQYAEHETLAISFFSFFFLFFKEVLALEKLQYLFHFLSLEFKDTLSGWKQQTDNLNTGVLHRSLKDVQHHMLFKWLLCIYFNNLFRFLFQKHPYLLQNYTFEALLTAMKPRVCQLLLIQKTQRPTWLPIDSTERN